MSLIQLHTNRQLTVPLELIDALGLRIGDYLEAKVEDNKLVFIIQKVQKGSKKVSLSDMFGTGQGAFVTAQEVDDYIAAGR